MAFPKLLQKLFQNNGAGSMLRADIIPTDSSLSSTSTNAIQNKTVNSALNEKLSLSGGTMAGDIQFSAGNIRFNKQTLGILGKTNDTYVAISPGPSNSYVEARGASLMMSGRDYTGSNMPKGAFALAAASEANTSTTLAGYPDGRLTWRGKNVITVVAESYETNSWYRKYSDGWIEQWGRFQVSSSGAFVITLSLAFSNTNYSFVYSTNIDGNTRVTTRDTTMVTFHSAGAPIVWWYACGK